MSNSKILLTGGAGSTVLNDIDSYVVAYGTPARVIRNRIGGEPYLKELGF